MTGLPFRLDSTKPVRFTTARCWDSVDGSSPISSSKLADRLIAFYEQVQDADSGRMSRGPEQVGLCGVYGLVQSREGHGTMLFMDLRISQRHCCIKRDQRRSCFWQRSGWMPESDISCIYRAFQYKNLGAFCTANWPARPNATVPQCATSSSAVPASTCRPSRLGCMTYDDPGPGQPVWSLPEDRSRPFINQTMGFVPHHSSHIQVGHATDVPFRAQQ